LNALLAGPRWCGAVHNFKRGDALDRAWGRGFWLSIYASGSYERGGDKNYISHIKGLPKQDIRVMGEQVSGQIRQIKAAGASVFTLAEIDRLNISVSLNLVPQLFGFRATMFYTVL
jgi:hypothetical protein